MNESIDRAQHVIGRHEPVEAKVVEKTFLQHEPIAHHRLNPLPATVHENHSEGQVASTFSTKSALSCHPSHHIECRLVAQMRSNGMSAIALMLRHKRTHLGRRKTDVIDPKPTFIASTRHRKPDIQGEIAAFAELMRRRGSPDQSYRGTGVFNRLESNEGATA
jgi:hypothetical protein